MSTSPGSDKSSETAGDSRGSSPATDQQANKSKAGIRVSLACVPCRSKHIKCDATMPTCLRCQAEHKPCFYAKSRRGIRDAKKRSMIADKLPHSARGPSLWPVSQLSTVDVPIRFLNNNMPSGWSLTRTLRPTSSPAGAAALLLDAFYSRCYANFPFLLPKPYMMSQLAKNATELRFLVSVCIYAASLYEPSISSDELREAVYNQSFGHLPMTAFTVQALALLSYTAIGEDKPELRSIWLDRAIQVAMDIGMQHRSFAENEPDVVVAESYRRTWWVLYKSDCIRATYENLQTFLLLSVPATVDLPCEEWEYQSGHIPSFAVSLAEYDSRDPCEEPTFSSWTYVIDLCRLVAEVVLPLHLYAERPWQDEVTRADMKISNWLVRIPKWKKEAIGPDGSPDLMLYSGICFALELRIRLRQPYERLHLSLVDGFAIGPLDRSRVTNDAKVGPSWNVCPPELYAANALLSVFTFPLSTSSACPVSIPVIERVCLALLDACVFLGCDTPSVREKLHFAFGILKTYGEVWPLAKRLAAGIKDVTSTYLPPTPGSGGDCHPAPAVSTSVSTSVSECAASVWTEALYPTTQHVSDHHPQVAFQMPFYEPFQEHVDGTFENWVLGGS